MSISYVLGLMGSKFGLMPDWKERGLWKIWDCCEGRRWRF